MQRHGPAAAVGRDRLQRPHFAEPPRLHCSSSGLRVRRAQTPPFGYGRERERPKAVRPTDIFRPTMRLALLDRFSALGSDFHRLLMSDALTLLALMVGQVALPWWIASEGGARDLALYGAVTSGFALVAMPLLSPLGDRLPKRRLIFGSLIAFALASVGVAALATIGHYQLSALIVLSAVPVLAMAALLPAVSSFSTELVPPQSLSRAMTLQQTAQATGRM